MTDAARDELSRIADVAAARFGGESPSPKASNSVAGRNPEGDASLPADDLAVGSLVWSRVRIGAEERHPGGMVVDVGMTEAGEPYVVILDEHVVEPIRAWKVRNRVVARRLMVADVDPALSQPADKVRMVGGARGAALTFGCGKGFPSVDERELVYYMATLMEQSQ